MTVNKLDDIIELPGLTIDSIPSRLETDICTPCSYAHDLLLLVYFARNRPLTRKNLTPMIFICVEFVTVLECLQAKGYCYLVVSSQQAMVLQQICVLKGPLKNVFSRQRVSRHLINIREILEKVVQDCASAKYKTFWAKFYVVSTTELPTLWGKVRAFIETPIDPLTYQAVSQQ